MDRRKMIPPWSKARKTMPKPPRPSTWSIKSGVTRTKPATRPSWPPWPFGTVIEPIHAGHWPRSSGPPREPLTLPSVVSPTM